MPHIILELSNNVIEPNPTAMLLEMHHLLTAMLPTQLSSCKSRILRHADAVVGDGNPNNAFVHLAIHVLPGRSEILLNGVANKLMDILKKQFSASASTLNLQFSIAIHDLPAIYHRS